MSAELSETKEPESVPNATEHDNQSTADGSSDACVANSTSESSSGDEYAKHITYDSEGRAIYTDPKTDYKYYWNTETSSWTPIDKITENPNETTNPYENEFYKWCSETNSWIPKVKATTENDSNSKVTETTETEFYKWDAERNEWIPKNNSTGGDVTYGYDEDGLRTYTDKDGMVFFWDVEKKAWFPKIDEDFMARYQMNYGFIDNTSTTTTTSDTISTLKTNDKQELNDNESESQNSGLKRKATTESPKWFDLAPEHNTKVYVSKLPLDITENEFIELMSKCGLIMRDPITNKPKVKLYVDSNGELKGDGLCDYIKVESVNLALSILDGSVIRGGNTISVQRAKFQMRGEYNPTLKPKRKKKDKEKLVKLKEKLFDWRPEKLRGERSKNERTVVIKNLFTIDLFDKEVQLIVDYKNNLRDECTKCGTVRKVTIYDRHPEGIAQVIMASPEEADLVIQMMNGRLFGQRKLTAETWDGKTKYDVKETEEEAQKRLSNWDSYLEKVEAEEVKKHE